MATPHATLNPTQLHPLRGPPGCGGMGWAGGGGNCCDISSFKYCAPLSLYLRFGQRCLFSMKQGTTQVRKIFNHGTGSCPLCSLRLSQFFQKTDPKKRTPCPSHLHHGLAISSNPVLLLQFFLLFLPLNSVSRRACGQGSICTHHFLQRRQSHGLWGKDFPPVTPTP